MNIEKDYQLILIRYMFHFPETIGEIVQEVKSYMLEGQMASLFQILMNLYIDGKEINIISIKEAILIDSELKSSTNKILSSIQRKPIGILKEHIQKIKEAYKKKMVVNTCEEIISEVKNNNSNVDTKIMDLIEYSQNTDEEDDEIHDLLTQDLIEFDNDILYRMLHGLVRGEILSIGAEPAHGKTSFSLWLLSLFIQRYKVMYISVELKRKQVLQKLISLKTQINSHKIIKKVNDLTSEEKETIRNEIDKFDQEYIKTRKLIIHDNLTSINEISIEIIKEKPDIVIIDWVQMMDMPESSNGNMARGIPSIFKIFKKTIKKVNAAGVMIGQLEIRNRVDKRPNINDFTDSTAFKKFSADVLLLFRPYQSYNMKKLYNIYELIYDKSRFGVIGSSLMKIIPEYGLFNNQLTPDMIKFYQNLRVSTNLP